MKKKWAGLILTGLAVLTLTGCGADPDAKKYALIVNPTSGEAESSYEQVWTGIEKFSNEQGVRCGKYTPEGTDEKSITAAIDQAVDEGAEVVFCIGEDSAEAVYKAQKDHKKTHFYLMEAQPHKEKSGEPSIRENTCAVFFDRAEEGFLAGYAAVSDGARCIGFMAGEKTADNEKLLAGYIQGAETAAQEMGLGPGEITLYKKYTGKNILSPAYMSDAISWYKNNCQIIFAPDEKVGRSVAKAAEEQNKQIIFADVSGMEITPQTLTSTRKDYAEYAYGALRAYVNEAFNGGAAVTVGVKENAVSLDMELSGFSMFSQETCNILYQNLAGGVYQPSDTAPVTAIVTVVDES